MQLTTISPGTTVAQFAKSECDSFVNGQVPTDNSVFPRVTGLLVDVIESKSLVFQTVI